MDAIPPEPSRLVAPGLGVSNGIMPTIRERLQGTAERRAFIVVLLVLGILFPLIDGNEGDIDAAANALAFAILALGLNIVVGFAGLLDLGYAAFFAIGAYTYGVFSSYQVQPEWWGFWEPFQWLGLVQHVHPASGPDTVHFTVSFWLMLPVSAIITAFFGVLFGAPTLRLKGDYLAIVTLGFGEIVPIVARNTPYLTNGSMGLNGVAPPNFFGYRFGVDSMPYYYVGLAMIVLLIFISYRLRDSRIGRAWMAIREDEIAAGAMGVNRVKLKLLAFAIGAGFAGSTGTLYVAKLQTATPEMFMFPVSVMILVMIVLGGMGSVAGVVLGALIQAALSGLGKGADLPACTPLLETRKLTKRFGGITAVKELDLVVMPHQIVALIGPNGSGKSTFFNVVTGLDPVDGGMVRFMGEDVTGQPAHAIVRRGI